MQRKQNKELVPFAKELRKNMTKEESHLWYDFLRNYPVRFMRQRVMGEYIADFYCAKAKLVVELDGSQHYEAENKRYDEARTQYLNGFGVEVLRFTNLDVKENFAGVCTCIDVMVRRRMGDGSLSQLR